MCLNVSRSVDRRAFVTKMAGASAGVFFLAGCSSDSFSGPLPPPPSGEARQIVPLSDLPGLATVGGRDIVNPVSPAPIGVTRTSATSFLGFSMLCARCYRGDVRPSAGGYQCINIYCGWAYAADGAGIGAASARSLDSIPVTFDAETASLVIG